MHRVKFVRFKTLIYVALYSFPPFVFQKLGEKLWIFLRNDCNPYRKKNHDLFHNKCDENAESWGSGILVCLLSWSSYPNSSNKDHLPFGECCKPLGLGDDIKLPRFMDETSKTWNQQREANFWKGRKKHPWLGVPLDLIFGGVFYGD